MKLTYFGHSCFSVQIAGKDILFDPFITKNDLAENIDIERIEANYIFLTHAHFDHITDAVAIARRTGALVVANFEVASWMEKQGIENVHPLNQGGSKEFDFGTVKCVNAVHSSSFPDGSYGGNPVGYVVESEEGVFYNSGDTALTMDMQLIGEDTKLDFAVLCIGDNFTMGVSDAVRACDLIRCHKVVGVHYDTFPPIKIDHEEAIAKFAASGKELHLLPIGGSAEL